MPIEDHSDSGKDSSEYESLDTGSEPIEGGWMRPSRRQVLAAVGALSLGTSIGTCNVAGGEPSETGPDSFEEFETAVDDALATAESVIDGGPHDPTWDSLEGVEQVPEWFRDGKFGIYFHWGLYSVPAFSTEWYPKWMYIPDTEGWGSEVHGYHVENYGEPDEYPYQDFAEEFTASEFDPEEWAELFEAAGATFAGPVAEHHDGWSNWASSINPFNAAAMGPDRDLVGELESAIRDRDMRFVTTFHHGRPAKEREGLEDKYYEGAYENYPSVTEGFPNQIMYRNVDIDLRWDTWFGKLVDAIDRYEPDLVWHDGIHNPPESVKREYLAYNYNRAIEENRDIVITHKEGALPLSVSVKDFENDRPSELLDHAWLTDSTLSTGAWSYTHDQEYKSTEQVIHELIDAVSKNGQMLLNLSPRADGTIPQPQRDRLEGIGEWLDTHGDAIYETRPWDLYGTGPNWLGGYSANDVRYTRSKDSETVYAVVMGWPDADTLTLNGTYVEDPSNAPSTPPGHGGEPPGRGDPLDAGPTEVTLLGHGPVAHGVDEHNHVVVDVPDLPESKRPSDAAVAFELTGFDLRGLTVDYVTTDDDIFVVRTGEGRHEITVTVYNLARGDAPPTTVRIDNASTDTLIGEAEIESLSLYENADATVEWDTSDIQDGTEQEIRVVVDPDGEVAEQDESNNVATTTVTPPVWPVDLAIDSLQPTDIVPGESVELTATITNHGTETAGATRVDVRDVTDDATRIAELSVPALDAGESADVGATQDTSGFEVGTVREVEAVVDPDGEVAEQDESNNAATTTVRLLDELPSNYESYASTEAFAGTWDDRYVINANGGDIWDDVDEYGAVYDPDARVDGTATASVTVVSQEDTDGWAKAGLMIRNDVTEAGRSPGYAAIMVTPDNDIEFEWDSDADGFVDNAETTGETTYPCWLRLEKDGETITGSYSDDGSEWHTVAAVAVPEADTVQDVAMFALSHTTAELGWTEFEGFGVG